MGNKSALNLTDFNTIESSASNTAAPFWNSNQDKKTKTIKVFKQIWRWTKIAILLFMLLMGLWGCIQSTADSTVAKNPTIGVGLEYGFPFGQTGDFRFDLQISPTAHQYNTFTRWGMYYGPFYGLFVWPAAWGITNFMYATRTWVGGLNTLLAIFILVLLIRILTLTMSLKSTLQTEKMNEVQGAMAEINAKYKDMKDMQSRQAKQNEINMLYKKYNIKPFAAFEQMFMTLPIFMIIYHVVTIVRPIKVTILFNIWNFALNPVTQVFSNFTHGGWTYLFFLILVIGAQAASILVPQYFIRQRNRSSQATSAAGKEQAKKNFRIQLIFAVVMSFLFCSAAVGVGTYGIFYSIFTIVQSVALHFYILHTRSKGKTPGILLSKFDL